jgi:DNA-binding PadR family transcriptional regulator
MALLIDGPQHGYALVDRLKDSPLMRGAKPDDTGVYRLLNSLEEQRLVKHRMAESKLGPSKRIYELTHSGRRCLTKWSATLDEYQKAIRELVALMRKAEAKISP